MSAMPDGGDDRARIERGPDGTWTLHLSGAWRIEEERPSGREAAILVTGSESSPGQLRFDASRLGEWDSSLLSFILHVVEAAEAKNVPVDYGTLPSGIHRLIQLARAVPEQKGTRKEIVSDSSILESTGGFVVNMQQGTISLVDFLGETTQALFRLVIGRAQTRASDFALVVEETGYKALPIIVLVNFLVGAILAYVGAIQLRQFGASIFVANLVVIAVLREMSSLMTAIILSGRTGASFAASIGTMTVNEEIDAMRTMGIRPIDFLVLPRILALALMTPLLVVFANVMGIFGGMVVGKLVLGLTLTQYIEQTRGAFELHDLFAGLIKGSVYGVIVALSGCLKGLQSGRSASAVGQAATQAAVIGIVSIIVIDLVMTILFDILGL